MLLHRGCTWLMLMPLLLNLSTGELSYYRDALPDATSEDLALRYLARYLEAQRLQQRLRRSHLAPPYLSPVHKKHMQEERDLLLEALTNKAALKNLLLQQKLMWTRYRQQHDPSINGPEIVPQQDYSSLLPYYGLKLNGYPDVVPNEDLEDRRDYGNGAVELAGYGYKARTNGDGVLGGAFDAGKGGRMMVEEPVMTDDGSVSHGRHADRDHHAGVLHEGGRETVAQMISGPKFTYKFDDSNLVERRPFAVKPNDPRYYDDAPFSSDGSRDRQDSSGMRRKEQEAADEGRGRLSTKHEDDDTRGFVNRKTPKDPMDALMPERSGPAYHPLIVPVNHDLNNDIYFIAIVAGCSAAAMFALVLISLTWCRLQRGAKAAADIEYPAYGVTGPNKDVSPSGDQRLAQSAQMYHFQHQKQQIIAMENRTSATRDPGSLSEAESDEENEEGDYTVYECPGLASTGEMEVKNPMFHDDPTPATPAQSGNKEEDHI